MFKIVQPDSLQTKTETVIQYESLTLIDAARGAEELERRN